MLLNSILFRINLDINLQYKIGKSFLTQMVIQTLKNKRSFFWICLSDPSENSETYFK